MLVVTLYIKDANQDYHQIHAWLDAMQTDVPHKVVEINIAYDPKLSERFGEKIPVIQVGPYILHWPFTEPELKVSLNAAKDRQQHYTDVEDKKYQARLNRGRTLSGADRFSLWFSKYYMAVISVLLLIYTGLPFLAPVFMMHNMPGPAKLIYTIYKPLCHQLAFRSIFLYGEQWFYPRDLAHVQGLRTYEEITHQDDADVLEARKFLGNEQVGYKVALCQRDIAMYASLFLFALIFLISGRKIKGIPWYIWIIFGMVPIAIDGFSQLPGIASSILPAWLPVRESTPVLRFVTGFLFGFTTAWYLFPMLEETMSDMYEIIKRKAMVVQQLNESEPTK